MTLTDLQQWILSDDGLGADLSLLSRLTAAKSISPRLSLDDTIEGHMPDWRRLVLAGSILSTSESRAAIEGALVIAQAGLLYSDNRIIAQASATVLAQLANHRTIELGIAREYLPVDYLSHLGVSERMNMARRELEHSIVPISGRSITTNRFQLQFWDELKRARWVSVSAPTASGKTYLVLQWLLDEFARSQSTLAIFLAPTRALVGEIERELIQLSAAQGVDRLRVASMPLDSLGDRSRPTILVFTQERLHVFINAIGHTPAIDILIVDEVHKIGEGLRGVILQDAIERVSRENPESRLVFLSPLTENPETLVDDAPRQTPTAVIPNDTPTVTQNLIVAEQVPRHSTRWRLSLHRDGRSKPLGLIELHSRPDTQIKRLSYVALAIGRGQSGTLIYANGAADAEKIAWQIHSALDPATSDSDPELQELSDLARDIIHPKFQLVNLVRGGVAFHYGNMPTLLRSEIERLFRKGSLKFLVCTSTLIEGVNLACRTIVVRGPKKGRGNPMTPQDFWNLAGRAGRWGQDFTGNIVCVDTNRQDLWPTGVPKRSRYPVRRETDNVLSRRKPMLDYLERRADLQAADIDTSLEQVTAYLLACYARDGTVLKSPSVLRLSDGYATGLEDRVRSIFTRVDIPPGTISRHPGVSAVSLQSLLDYFRSRPGPIEELLPDMPESSDALPHFIAIFYRINKHLYPAFFPNAAVPVQALVTIEWMRGVPLGQIIRKRIGYLDEKKREYNLAAVIRDTMRDVEEVARFRAPKYLSAYLDVLKYYLDEQGRSDLFPAELRFDLYLEFGVATQTLVSLIGLGLSRTSAVAINDFLGDDALEEERVLEWLVSKRGEELDLPAIVRREVRELLARHQG